MEITLPGYLVDRDHLEYLIKEPVSGFKLAPGCQATDGFGSALKSITVSTRSGQVLYLIHKSLDEEDQVPKEITLNSFKTEILIYERLIPKLEILAQSRGLTDSFPVPRFFGSAESSQLSNTYLCLEDVRPLGFQMKDKYIGLNLPEAELVMIELAKFHAQTYLLIKWEGEKIFESDLVQLKICPGGSKYWELILTEDGQKMFRGTLANAIAVMGKRNTELSRKLELFQVADGCTSMDTTHKTDTVYFPVILHGDIWVNNILFKYDASGLPTELKFIDFQHSRRGNIFEDLQYFVFTSTTPAFRKKYLSQILNSYFESFVATLKRLNFPAPINFTLEFLITHFQNCYIPIYRYMTFVIPLQLGAPKDQMMEKVMHANGSNSYLSADGTAMTEMDPFEMMVVYSRLALEASPAALDRLESITQEFVDLKLI